MDRGRVGAAWTFLREDHWWSTGSGNADPYGMTTKRARARARATATANADPFGMTTKEQEPGQGHDKARARVDGGGCGCRATCWSIFGVVMCITLVDSKSLTCESSEVGLDFRALAQGQGELWERLLVSI